MTTTVQTTQFVRETAMEPAHLEPLPTAHLTPHHSPHDSPPHFSTPAIPLFAPRDARGAGGPEGPGGPGDPGDDDDGRQPRMPRHLPRGGGPRSPTGSHHSHDTVIATAGKELRISYPKKFNGKPKNLQKFLQDIMLYLQINEKIVKINGAGQ